MKRAEVRVEIAAALLRASEARSATLGASPTCNTETRLTNYTIAPSVSLANFMCRESPVLSQQDHACFVFKLSIIESTCTVCTAGTIRSSHIESCAQRVGLVNSGNYISATIESRCHNTCTGDALQAMDGCRISGVEPKHQPHDTLLAFKPRSVRMTHPNGEFMVGHLRHRLINADSWTVGMCQEE
ncbi:hypothetical protein PC115_g20349 [Phytophthora cactorum]|uniref:Uncharacterized protein n=2 Tax=Phytophthora cactorum TaxID=29920 RepID=A0A8T1AUP0_9STRA|nr:hypothetical protein PC115_g20349 [Phytophthora cactorum]